MEIIQASDHEIRDSLMTFCFLALDDLKFVITMPCLKPNMIAMERVSNWLELLRNVCGLDFFVSFLHHGKMKDRQYGNLLNKVIIQII